MIIGISGKKGSGKNDVGAFLKDYVSGGDSCGTSVCLLAFADPIKEIVCDYFGVSPEIVWGTQKLKEETLTDWYWDEIPCLWGSQCYYGPKEARKKVTVRELLQWVGTEVFRNNVHWDFWVKVAFNRIKKKFSAFQHHIITDVRFPNEVMAIKDAGGKVIRLWRTVNEAEDSHTSENALDSQDNILRKKIKFSNETSAWFDVVRDSDHFDYLIVNNGPRNFLQLNTVGLAKELGF
jgi:hypothetical protein